MVARISEDSTETYDVVGSLGRHVSYFTPRLGASFYVRSELNQALAKE